MKTKFNKLKIYYVTRSLEHLYTADLSESAIEKLLNVFRILDKYVKEGNTAELEECVDILSSIKSFNIKTIRAKHLIDCAHYDLKKYIININDLNEESRALNKCWFWS